MACTLSDKAVDRMMAGVILRAAGNEFGERSGVSPMALDLIATCISRGELAPGFRRNFE